MQVFILTILLALPLVAAFMWLYSRRRAPRFRIERDDFQDLLEDAVAGRARHERWELMTGIPARFDEDLLRWQQQCRRLEEGVAFEIILRERARYCRFNASGKACLQRILQEMSLQQKTAQRLL